MMPYLSIKVWFRRPVLAKNEKAKTRKNQDFLLKGTKKTNGRKPVRGEEKSDHRMGDRIFVVHKSMYPYSVVIML